MPKLWSKRRPDLVQPIPATSSEALALNAYHGPQARHRRRGVRHRQHSEAGLKTITRKSSNRGHPPVVSSLIYETVAVS